MRKKHKTLVILLVLLPIYLLAQKIHFKSNPAIKQTLLDSISKSISPFDKSNIPEQNAQKLINKLQTLGYLDATIDSSLMAVKTFFYISVGEKTDSITLIMDKNLQSLLNKKTHKYNIPIKNVRPYLEQISTTLNNKGYPFDQVYLKDIQRKENLQATIHWKSTKIRYIDTIIIKGYTKFPRAFLQNSKRKKMLYNTKNIKKLQNQIQTLPFAKNTKAPEALFTPEKTQLYFYIEKQNRNSFDGLLAMQNLEGKNQLTGQLHLVLTNNLHQGESLIIQWKSNPDKHKTFTAQLKIPYVFNSPFSLMSLLSIEKRDSIFANTKTRLHLQYKISPNFSISSGITKTSSNALQKNSTQPLESFTKNNYEICFNYDFLKTSLLQKNTAISLETSFGSRVSKTKKQDQIYIALQASYPFDITPRSLLYLKTDMAYLYSDAYLENEKLRLGGIQALRGVKEQSLSATTYAGFSTEYQYYLNQSIYAHGFMDYLSLKDQSPLTHWVSVGGGLGIRKNNSNFKLSYARASSLNTTQKNNAAQIHIQYSSFF